MKTLIISDCCRKEVVGCGCGACLSARTCSKCKQPCRIWDIVEIQECCDRCNAQQISPVLGASSCWDYNCHCHIKK